jgi:short subunit dehydrogenase-like uncharacterized protein
VSPRIVVFGATGYTGELVASALVARGAAPVLAGRSRERLEALAASLGDGATNGSSLEIAVADVADPASVRALVAADDVLVSTVGPFSRFGRPAVDAAIDARAHYLDSTGEGAFIRTVFEDDGPRAQAAGCALLTAFGCDWVPGNVAGALALQEAGQAAVRVAIGYYATGAGMGSDATSGGTQASVAGAMLSKGFAWRDGRIVTERNARRVSSFELWPGHRAPSFSVSGTEHFALPRLQPGLREVDLYLGWSGSMSRPISILSAGMSAVTAIPGVRGALSGLAAKMVKGSTGGPSAEDRERTGTLVLAQAFDALGKQLSDVRLEGSNPYTFTGAILAWGAHAAASGALRGTGALGPVDAFGLDDLAAGTAEAGISRV